MALGKGTAKDVLGQRGERYARQYLTAQGLRFVDHNVRFRVGEIDLIMQHAETLVFIEVRVRSGSSHGGAALSVNRRKQQKFVKAVKRYCLTQQIPSRKPLRIDIVALCPIADDDFEVEWIRDAFSE